MSDADSSAPVARLYLTHSRWDLSTFTGRLRHYAAITNPLLCLNSDDQVHEARQFLLQRADWQPSGSADSDEERVWRARHLCAAALHPETGQLQPLPGRMCFQVPGGMALIGAMTAFYRSTPAVLFWQWANQSFNAFVNLTNAGAGVALSRRQLATAYLSATGCAMLTAGALKRLLKVGPPVLQRFVPLVAVLAANFVNVPLMRQTELDQGLPLRTGDGRPLDTQSRVAAVVAISQVVAGRCVIVAPGMLLLPLLVRRLERHAWYVGRRWLHVPLQTTAAGAVLVGSVPLGCALFCQTAAVDVDTLERHEPLVHAQLVQQLSQQQKQQLPAQVYFNKGL